MIWDVEFLILDCRKVALLRSGSRRLGRSFEGLSPYYVPQTRAEKTEDGGEGMDFRLSEGGPTTLQASETRAEL